MLQRKFVCYSMVLAIGLLSVSNLFAGWFVHSNTVGIGIPPDLTSVFEVDLNRHWQHEVWENVAGKWNYRALVGFRASHFGHTHQGNGSKSCGTNL